MANASPPEPVRFFVPVLAANTDCLEAARNVLEAEWGPVELAPDPLPFTYTDYYNQEAGPNILRGFFSFAEPFDPGDLAGRKIRTNAMEEELASALQTEWPRPVNLDPGYLAPDKLVLASAKNFSHRIYIGQGIYAEVTLMYRFGEWVSFEWTFPDYSSGDYYPFFFALRKCLMQDREETRKRSTS